MFRLVPRPQFVRMERGVFSPGRTIYVESLPPDADEGSRLALFDLMTELRSASRRPVYPTSVRRNAAICCRLHRKTQSESYSLVVGSRKIEVVGNGIPGLFYGIQTLRQLVRQFGTQIPCCVIRDAPSFPHRAFLLDISRGRVPRMETLRRLVDVLAHLKYNQLQLYVEHPFAFSFDPSISTGCDALTSHEVEALADYGRTRHVQLVPCLACFGHMGRILSLPRYRPLAEVPWPAGSWETSPWIQRLRGATINPRHPQAQDLLRRMLDDFLPHFSSPFFNMCGDETYDLGKGSNARWVQRHGMGSLYAMHIRFLHQLAAAHGKRLMLWGDMLLKHRDAIDKLPKDCIVLDWGYEPDTDFSKIRVFIEAGMDAYACPSTRGYRVVFNEVEKARANIAGYAREAACAGAGGLLITDWGDMGHFNLPAASLHGLALGAAMAWNTRADAANEFDRAFALQIFGDAAGAAASAFKRAGSCDVKSWPLMLTDVPSEWATADALARAEKTLAAASRCATAFDKVAKGVPKRLPEGTADELRLACRAIELTARKIQLFGRKRNPDLRACRAYADDLWNYFHEYASVWRLHYKPMGLQDLERAFRRAVRRLRGGDDPVTRNDLP